MWTIGSVIGIFVLLLINIAMLKYLQEVQHQSKNLKIAQIAMLMQSIFRENGIEISHRTLVRIIEEKYNYCIFEG